MNSFVYDSPDGTKGVKGGGIEQTSWKGRPGGKRVNVLSSLLISLLKEHCLECLLLEADSLAFRND